jgi:hypothetical protein
MLLGKANAKKLTGFREHTLKGPTKAALGEMARPRRALYLLACYFRWYQ